MTTEHDILAVAASVIQSGDYSLSLQAPLLPDGTVDAEGLARTILTPAVQTIARLAQHLATERGETPDQVIEDMQIEARFDEIRIASLQSEGNGNGS